MPPSVALRVQLSRRLRAGLPLEWTRFAELWLAFNAIYGGEPDAKERARVKSAIRNAVSQATARAVLRRTAAAVDRILALPPGNMLLEQWDPRFRRTSRELARIYRSPSESPVTRLVAVGAILYQVRCNLLHGSKDPQASRDRMLVRESVRVLELLVPEVERGALSI